MWKWVVTIVCLCCCSGWGKSWAMSPQDGVSKQPVVSPEVAAIQDLLRVYCEVYNKHDAGALAQYWAPNAVSMNTESGTRLAGRDAIKAAFVDLFQSEPNSKLNIRLKYHRFIKPELLSIEGEATVSTPNQETSENTFTALLVKVGDKWLIEQASESPLPVPATPYEGLKALEWMVGTWTDDTKGVTVESQMKWNEKKTFLIRKYSVLVDGETEADTGTQLIGWDPRSKAVRSWTFCSDGSFGDAVWSNTENEWRVKFNHINADGSVHSGTQVITKLDQATAQVQIVGSEIDGELGPARPAVKMIKKANTTEDPKP